MSRESSQDPGAREVAAPTDEEGGSPQSVADAVTEAGNVGDSMDALLREVAAAPPMQLGGAAGVELSAGDMIGESFRIEEPLGAGGMGVVYKARDLELDRPVAIKLRRGAADPGDVARLLREAKVMAQLTHPNVVTVYEVGTHHGQLFIAMEYVDAGSLRTWLKQKPRGWKEVVELFAQAGRGLAAAHAMGLIHRDFKPDNVLVDRTGRALVADFGVARLAETAAPAADLTSLETSSLGQRLTRTGAAVGTPAYMAPEQFIGGEIGPAADQFAFCVSLHEALWGRRPFAGRDVNELIAAVALERTITPKGGDVPAWIRRVVLRGIRASPDDRWPSMEAMLAALSRDPAARRRSIAMLGTALVATAAGAWWAATRGITEPCEGSDALIAQVWSEPRREAMAEAFSATELAHADTARAAVEGSLDEYAGEWATMVREACEATHVHGVQSEMLMDRRMACLAERSSALEGLVRVLSAADRDVVEHSTRLVGSLPPIARCADGERLLEGVPPPDDPAAAETVAELRARLSEYQALAGARRPREAIEEMPAVVAEAEATAYEPVIVEALFVNAQLEQDTGAVKDAERDLDAALWRAIRIGHDEYVPRIAVKLAFTVGYSKGDHDQGERLLRLAEATLERDASPSQRANLQGVRGAIAQHAGDYTGAATAFRARLALEEGASDPDQGRVADALGSLAATFDYLGEFEEAERAYVRAISLAESAEGPAHPSVGKLVGDLAIHMAMRGEPASAIPLFVRAIAIGEQAVGPEAPALIHLLQNLTKTQLAIHDLEGAEATLARARAIRSKSGEQDPSTDAQLLETELFVAKARERWQECIDLAAESVRMMEGQVGADHPKIAVPLAVGAACANELGRAGDAESALKRALALRDAAFGESSEPVAQILSGLTDVYVATGDQQALLTTCDRALAIFEGLGRERTSTYERLLRRREKARAALGLTGREPTAPPPD